MVFLLARWVVHGFDTCYAIAAITVPAWDVDRPHYGDMNIAMQLQQVISTAFPGFLPGNHLVCHAQRA